MAPLLASMFLMVGQVHVGIGIDTASPRGLSFASHLADELDTATTVRDFTLALDTILGGDHPAWPEPLLVFYDAQTSRVAVVRRSDGTVLLRALEPEGAGSSSYAMAIAAAELLRFAYLPIPAKGAPLTPSRLQPALMVSLGVEIMDSFGAEPIATQLRLTAGADLLDRTRGMFSRLAIGLRAPIEISTAQQLQVRRWGPPWSWLRAGRRTGFAAAVDSKAASRSPRCAPWMVPARLKDAPPGRPPG